MKTQLIALVVSLLTIAPTYAQTPDPTTLPKVAVLELEMSKGIINNAIARDDFRKLTADEVLVTPLKGERPSNLTALFGCNDMDAACLKQVSTSLQARFILFGYLTLTGTQEKFLVSLYDAEANKILAIEEASFVPENRATEMQKTIRKVLRAPGTETIRKAQKIEPPENPKENPSPAAKSGKWKYAVPVAFGVASLGLGAGSFALESSLTSDGNRTPEDATRIQNVALTADIVGVIAVGAGVWAVISNKKAGSKAASAEQGSSRK